MKFIKISFFLFAFSFCFSTAQAQQGGTLLDIQYTVGLPMGSFKDQLSKSSARGFQASILYGLSDQFSIGFGTGFQDFYQKDPRQLYKLSDGSDVSAVLSRSIQTIPLLAQAKWGFAPGRTVQPYAALGLGGTLISYTELLGEFGGRETKFGFAARPEAGVFVPFRKGGEGGLTLGASYNVMPFHHSGFSNLNFLGLHAGVQFPLRD